MSKTQVSCRRGSIKAVWLDRVCMAKAKAATPPSMQTTTTTVPDGGSLFPFLHIFVGHLRRHLVLLHFLQRWLHGVLVSYTTASAHESVDDTEMPGVHELAGCRHTLLDWARRHGIYHHHSHVFFSSLYWVGVMLLCQTSRSASLVVFVMAIACT